MMQINQIVLSPKCHMRSREFFETKILINHSPQNVDIYHNRNNKNAIKLIRLSHCDVFYLEKVLESSEDTLSTFYLNLSNFLSIQLAS